MKPHEGMEQATTVGERSLRIRRAMKGCSLAVIKGADMNKRFVVDGSGALRVLLGQSPACEIRLSDPKVSRRHAALEMDTRGVRFTDLNSTNGSFINGVSVIDAYLTGGETLKVGDTTLRVSSVDNVVEPPVGEANFGNVLGASAEMRRLYPLCARMAASNVPIVIEGETGTGKEVLAEAIHDSSTRSGAPFVVFDCTTVAPSLVESTLFGHERGSFTGAIKSQKGLFEEADTGTLFIDEIGDLELGLQAKLLRAIERSEVRRVGASKWSHVDVRIVAATRRDLDKEVQAGRFRDDLFFRLAVARIELPPLRRRLGDIGLLATHFWEEMGGDPMALTSDFLERLEAYDWPGNVRELRNAIAQRVALGDLSPQELPAARASQTLAPPAARDESLVAFDVNFDEPFPIAKQHVLLEFERVYVERVLERHGGHVGKAADASGIGRRYFQTIRGRHR